VDLSASRSRGPPRSREGHLEADDGAVERTIGRRAPLAIEGALGGGVGSTQAENISALAIDIEY